MNKENYRLVSFLSHLSKVVEIILHNQHNGYMKNKLSNISYWLSKRSQSATLIVDHDEKWKRALHENMKVGAIFMDISIAFDTLNHRLPLAKLKALFTLIQSLAPEKTSVKTKKIRNIHNRYSFTVCLNVTFTDD